MKTNSHAVCLLLASALLGIGVTVEAQPTFNPNPDNWVFSVATDPEGWILVGGSLSYINGEAHYRLARLDPDGNVDSGFNPSLDGSLRSILAQADGKIVVGGTFVTTNGATRNRIARLNHNGTLDTGFNPNANAAVLTIVEQPNGQLLMGGDFTSVSGGARNHFARLHASGALDATFNPNVDDTVFTAAVQPDGKIIIGGLFTSVGGVARTSLARLNPDGTLDPGFNPGANSSVLGLALQADGRILIGGNFTTVGGVVRNRMARLNADGTVDATFDPNVNNTVFSMAVQTDGRTVITGGFTAVGGLTRNRIARLDADGSPDPTLNPDANDWVYGAALQVDGKILLVGSFTSLGGVPINRMARLDSGPVTESTYVTATRIEWLRGGASPEAQRVSFELSTDGGTVFTPLGDGTRIAGGWELTGLNLPYAGTIRARARTSGGMYNASSGWVELQFPFSGVGGCPTITLPALPTGYVGSAYMGAVTASPTGSYEYFVVFGSLPPGLWLESEPTGQILGTPTDGGTFAFTAFAFEVGTSCWGVREYQLEISSSPSPSSAVFSEDFSDNSAGWTLEDEWQIGAAVAGGGGVAETFPDPASDTTPGSDNGVAGMVIGGNITTALHTISYLTSPAFDTTGLPVVELSFQRWLNSDYLPYMDSRVEVWTGSTWVQVWEAPPGAVVGDSSWALQRIDVSAYSNAEMRVRFGTGVGSTGAYPVSGWNIDDVRVGPPLGAPITELVENFSDNSAGWTMDAEWQIGPAVQGGGGTQFPDPATDTTSTADNGVAGMVIGGDITTALHSIAYLTSPPVDTTDLQSVELSFQRWLNSDYLPYMDSRVEVWTGSAWAVVWQAPPATPVADSSWVAQRIDISAYSNAELRVRFGTGVGSAGAYSVSGWNIDDVRIGAPAGELRIEVASIENGAGGVSGWVYDPVADTSTPFACEAVAGATATCNVAAPPGAFVVLDAAADPSSVVDGITGCEPIATSPYLGSCTPFAMEGPGTVAVGFRGPQTLTLNVESAENGQGLLAAEIYSIPFNSGTTFVCSGVAGVPTTCTTLVRIGDDVRVRAESGNTSVLDSMTPCEVTYSDQYFGNCIPLAMADEAAVTATFRGPQTLTLNVESAENGQGLLAAEIYSIPFNSGTTFVCPGVAGVPTTCTTLVRIGDDVRVRAESGNTSVLDSMTPCEVTYSDQYFGNCIPLAMADEAAVTATFRGPQTLTLNVESAENGQGLLAAEIYSIPFNSGTTFVCPGVAGVPTTCTTLVRIGDDVRVRAESGNTSVLDSMTPCEVTYSDQYFGNCIPLAMADEAAVTATFRGPQTLTLNVESAENGQGLLAAEIYSIPFNSGTTFVCPGVAGVPTTCTTLVRIGDDVRVRAESGNTSVLDSMTPCEVTYSDQYFGNCIPLAMADEAAVTATFRGPQTLTLNLESVGGGQGTVFGSIYSLVLSAATTFDCAGTAGAPATCTVPVRIGDEISLAAQPEAGSIVDTLAGCTVIDPDALSPACETFPMAPSAATITVAFRRSKTLTLDLASVENGIGSVAISPEASGGDCHLAQAGQSASCARTFTAGTALTLTATPNGPLSVFEGWTGACAPNGSSATCSIVLSDDTPVGATFHGPQNLTVTFNGAGSGAVLTPGAECQSASVSCVLPIAIGPGQLVAQPSPTSDFVSWSGACAGQGPVCQVNVGDDLLVVASFAPKNHAPIAAAGGPYAQGRNLPITFSGGASNDPDGNPLTYAWTFGDGETGTGVAPVHSYATIGTFPVTLIVNDGFESSAASTTSAIISNQAAVAVAGGPYNGVRNEAITFSGSGSSDPNGDALTYAWDFGDGSAAGTGVAPTHAYATTGTFTVTLSVSDGTEASAPSTATVSVANRPPVALVGDIAATTFRAVSIPFSGADSTDPDGDALTYSWDFGDGVTATGSTTSHAFGALGSFTVTLTVTDGTETASATRSIEVLNRKPVASIPVLSPYRNVALVASGSQCSDQDGDPMTYRWDFGDGSLSTEAAPSHTYATLGDFTISLVVNDGFVDSDVVTRVVTVQNNPPSVVSTSVPEVSYRNTTINVSAVGQDDNGDPLTYAWTFGDGGTGSGISASHSYTAVGTYTVSATASDGVQTSAPHTKTISIVNRSPVASLGGPYSGTRLAPIAFNSAGSSDPDGDPLTYLWDFGDGATGAGPAPTHLYASAGTFAVTLIVNDGLASSPPQATTVSIANLAPSVTLTTPGAGATLLTTANVTLAAVASDPDGTVTKVEFFASGVKVGESTTAPFSVNWPPTASGSYLLTAKATDSNGTMTTSSSVSVYRDAPPLVSLTAPVNNAQYAAPASITLNAAASDSDGSITRVEFFRGATSLGVDTSSPYSVVWTGATVGAYTLTAVATDNLGVVVASAPITVKVTAALAPTADAEVRGSNTNSNYGTATTLAVRQGSSTSDQRWTYLKFDVSSVPTISNAKIRVFGAVSATTSTVIQTAAYPVTDTTWTETGIKWKNKPASGAAALSTVTIVNNSTTARWYELDVTAYLQAEKAAGRNVVTLVLKNLANSTPFVTLSSGENATVANRPHVLVVP